MEPVVAQPGRLERNHARINRAVRVESTGNVRSPRDLRTSGTPSRNDHLSVVSNKNNESSRSCRDHCSCVPHRLRYWLSGCMDLRVLGIHAPITHQPAAVPIESGLHGFDESDVVSEDEPDSIYSSWRRSPPEPIIRRALRHASKSGGSSIRYSRPRKRGYRDRKESPAHQKRPIKSTSGKESLPGRYNDLPVVDVHPENELDPVVVLKAETDRVDRSLDTFDLDPPTQTAPKVAGRVHGNSGEIRPRGPGVLDEQNHRAAHSVEGDRGCRASDNDTAVPVKAEVEK